MPLLYTSRSFYMYNLSYYQTLVVQRNIKKSDAIRVPSGFSWNYLWVSSTLRFIPSPLGSSLIISSPWTSSFPQPTSLSLSLLLLMGSLFSSRWENWHLCQCSLFPHLYLVYGYSVLHSSKYFVTSSPQKSLADEILSNFIFTMSFRSSDVKSMTPFLCSSTVQPLLLGLIYLDSHEFLEWGDRMGVEQNTSNEKHIDEYQSITLMYLFY